MFLKQVSSIMVRVRFVTNIAFIFLKNWESFAIARSKKAISDQNVNVLLSLTLCFRQVYLGCSADAALQLLL